MWTVAAALRERAACNLSRFFVLKKAAVLERCEWFRSLSNEPDSQ